MMRNALVTAMVFACVSGVALVAAENEPPGERQKEPHSAGDKKKHDVEKPPSTAESPASDKHRTAETGEKSEPKSAPSTSKSTEPGSKTSPDDKNTKPEEAPAPVPKQDDSGGKATVTSVNLTIKLALMADPLLFPYEIEVEMDGQKAKLTGTVPTEEDKSKVTEIVRKVDGVESVVNKLIVSPGLRIALAKKQDDAITHYVKERLTRSETLKAVGFDVKSENGVVSLSGKTRFQVIALEAAEAARQIPGVRAVNTAAVQITGKD